MPASLTLCPELARTFDLLPTALLAPEPRRRLGRAPVPHAAARRATRRRALLDFIDARSGFVEHKGRNIATWRWGGSRATRRRCCSRTAGAATPRRCARFVLPLLAAGYRVIAYDQPAHGLSEGKLTGLPDFADVLAAVAASHGGGAARDRAFARRRGRGASPCRAACRSANAVLVSPPSDLVGYSRRFARWHWIPEPLRRSMQAAIEERYGVRWEELEVARLAPRLNARRAGHPRPRRPHGALDAGRALARAWPGARLLSDRRASATAASSRRHRDARRRRLHRRQIARGERRRAAAARAAVLTGTANS